MNSIIWLGIESILHRESQYAIYLNYGSKHPKIYRSGLFIFPILVISIISTQNIKASYKKAK